MNGSVTWIITIIIFISFLPASAQNNPISANNVRIKKSQIKTRTEYTYFLDKPKKERYLVQKRYYDKKGNDTLTEFFSLMDNFVFSKSRKIFNNEGKVVEKIDLKPVGETSKNTHQMKKKREKKFGVDIITKFEYDQNNNLISKKMYDSLGENIKSYSFVFRYANGKPVEVKNISEVPEECSREVLFYDEKGRDKVHVFYDNNDKRGSSNEYLYDADGNQDCILYFNSKSELFEIDSTFFNSLGNKVKKFKYKEDSTKIWRIDFIYNKKNNMVKSVREYFISVDYKQMITTFDDNGNILSITKCNADLKPTRMQKYIYSYY